MNALKSFTRGGLAGPSSDPHAAPSGVDYIAFKHTDGSTDIRFFSPQKTSSFERSLAMTYASAWLKCRLMGPDTTQSFQSPLGRTFTLKARDILKNPWVRGQIQQTQSKAQKALTQSLWSMFLTTFLVIFYFILRGKLTNRIQLECGGRVVEPHVLKRLIRRENLASDLHLDGLPLIKNKETSHILITGTTGSGKTNCLHTLLPQIRRRPNRAIIVDLTGDFITRYYDENRDILLAPFDERTQHWNPWSDCQTEAHYDTLAAAIVPKSSLSEPFWENAGKALLSAALKKLSSKQDIQKLYDILVRADLKDFSTFFRGTDAAPYTHGEGEKMTLSIRATLANHLQSFRYLTSDPEGFSIRNWVTQEQDSWLFLCTKPDQRETLRPLISGWLDTALNALMTLPPDPKRRLWFVMDELPSLQRLPSLETALAEGRKYGGCVLAGLQSIPQITSLYGSYTAQSLLDLFNTKIFFRNTDPNTTAWISKVLGEAETKEAIENLSYGANTMRDGVNLTQHNRTKPLVLPSEIAALQDLTAFLKLPTGMPTSKMRMGYKKFA